MVCGSRQRLRWDQRVDVHQFIGSSGHPEPPNFASLQARILQILPSTVEGNTVRVQISGREIKVRYER